MKLLGKYSETRSHYDAWWNKKGSVLNISIIDENKKGVEYDNANWKADVTCADYYLKYHTDKAFNIEENLKRVRKSVLMGDTLPLAMPDYGAIALAAYLGAKIGFGEDTVWYSPCMNETNKNLPLWFDSDNIWWKTNMEIMEGLKAYGDEIFIGAPCLSPGLDTLYQLRGAESMMIDLISDPKWVHEKLQEIQSAFFQAYDRIYDIIKLNDGSMVFGYFSLWGNGKTSQMQCDVSALISPKMFNEFELPYLIERCEKIHHTLYHLDGVQAIMHLDSLLGIHSLDAIEWSPQAGQETGGNKRWYPLYEKILKAGKGLQIVEALPDEIIDIFHHFGTDGINVMTAPMTKREAEDLLERVAVYR